MYVEMTTDSSIEKPYVDVHLMNYKDIVSKTDIIYQDGDSITLNAPFRRVSKLKSNNIKQENI